MFLNSFIFFELLYLFYYNYSIFSLLFSYKTFFSLNSLFYSYIFHISHLSHILIGWWVTSAAGLSNVTNVHCTVKGLSGTSMATPLTAGAVALIRQYFIQGYYPSGSINPMNSLIPSGALLKAMLIASGQPLQMIATDISGDSTSFSFSTITSYPSNDQGYGRIELNQVLNFNKKSTNNPLSLFIIGTAYNNNDGMYQTLATGETKTYSFVITTITSDLPNYIRIVLTYTDVPVQGSPMINQLKLTAQSHGINYIPYNSNSNVQMLDIKNPIISQIITVTISAFGTISSGPQAYALVVTGSIQFVNSSIIVSDNSQSTIKSRITRLQNVTISDFSKDYIIALTIIIFFISIIAYYFYKSIKLKDKEDELAFHTYMEEMNRRYPNGPQSVSPKAVVVKRAANTSPQRTVQRPSPINTTQTDNRRPSNATSVNTTQPAANRAGLQAVARKPQTITHPNRSSATGTNGQRHPLSNNPGNSPTPAQRRSR